MTTTEVGLSAESWSALANPRSIAVVGASESGVMTKRLLQTNADLGYRGEIHFVNPRRDTVYGRSCWPSLSALPESIDAAIIAVPRDYSAAVVAEAIDKGVRALVVHSGGFGERGAQGDAIQRQLSRMADAAGVPMLGPNCMGIRHFNNGCSISTFPPLSHKAGPVAAISQSGMVAMLMEALAQRFGLSFLASTGNEALTTTEDLIACAIEDPSTRVIAAFIEQLRAPEHLFTLGERAMRAGKPIIVLKAGMSERGSRVSLGHTGALAGSGAVYRQAFEQAGIVMVGDFDELAQTIELFLNVRAFPVRTRTAVLGISGGQLAALADQADELGVELPAPSPATQAELQEIMALPEDVLPINPLDIGTSFSSKLPYPERMRLCIEALAKDDNVDVVALLQQFYKEGGEQMVSRNQEMISAAARASKNTDKQVIVFSGISGLADEEVLADARAAGLPVLQGSRETLCALGNLARYGRRREKGWTSFTPTIAPGSVDVLAGRSGFIPQAELFTFLRGLGISAAPAIFVTGAGAAEEAVRTIGGPAVMKIETQRIVHKSDVGGVVLGVDEDNARQMYERIIACVEPPIGTYSGEGVIVSQQVGGGVEFYIGAKRDESFGAVIICGLGGRYVELLQKTAMLIAPFSAEDALEAIERSGVRPFLEGFRGGPVADFPALAQMMVRIGDLAKALGERLEVLDLNPVIVSRDYPGGRIVDARLSLREVGDDRPN